MEAKMIFGIDLPPFDLLTLQSYYPDNQGFAVWNAMRRSYRAPNGL